MTQKGVKQTNISLDDYGLPNIYPPPGGPSPSRCDSYDSWHDNLEARHAYLQGKYYDLIELRELIDELIKSYLEGRKELDKLNAEIRRDYFILTMVNPLIADIISGSIANLTGEESDIAIIDLAYQTIKIQKLLLKPPTSAIGGIRLYIDLLRQFLVNLQKAKVLNDKLSALRELIFEKINLYERRSVRYLSWVDDYEFSLDNYEAANKECDPDEPPPDDEEPLDDDTSNPVQPIDPNEKAGPIGVGSSQIINVSDSMGYIIYFENVMTATAPAQIVTIVDHLDADLDWFTFRPTEITFGNQIFAITEQGGSFYTRATIPDYRAGINQTWWVDITATIDYQTGTVIWIFTTLDPLTGEPPTDPLAGFLPPEDGSGRGQGYVSFSIYPKADLVNGTLLTNQAAITFDSEATITTNVWSNQIGPTHIVFLPVIVR